LKIKIKEDLYDDISDIQMTFKSYKNKALSEESSQYN